MYALNQDIGIEGPLIGLTNRHRRTYIYRYGEREMLLTFTD
jgi:hypothetical protein